MWLHSLAYILGNKDCRTWQQIGDFIYPIIDNKSIWEQIIAVFKYFIVWTFILRKMFESRDRLQTDCSSDYRLLAE